MTQLDYLRSKGTTTWNYAIGGRARELSFPPFSADPVPTAVKKLANEFRASADELVDLLDLKKPSTVKLKVGVHLVRIRCHVTLM